MSKFFELKMRTLFNRFDINQNGTIEEVDFENWAEKLISLGNLDEAKANELRENIKRIWREHFKNADKNNDGIVSFEEFFGYISESLADGRKREVLTRTIPIIYDAIDADSDGLITTNEFGIYFQSINVFDEKATKLAFMAMDLDADGCLSRNEFSTFGKDFFLSVDEESPSKYFFGPLVKH